MSGALSFGQAQLLRALRQRPRLIGRLGVLRGVAPQLEARGLAERYAPGASPARTMLRITPAGTAALSANPGANGRAQRKD